MLQFWKKSGQREKGDRTRSSSSSPAKSAPASPKVSNGGISETAFGGMDTVQVGPLSGFVDDELAVGDLGECDGSPTGGRKAFTRSRLSKTLAEVLSDKGALAYFIQYLDARDSVTLVKFWLDVESFRSASCARGRSDGASGRVTCIPVTREQLLGAGDSAVSYMHSPHHDQDKLSLGTDCDSTLGDSSSVYESPVHSGGSTNDISQYSAINVKSVISNTSRVQSPTNINSRYKQSILTLPTFPASTRACQTPLETECTVLNHVHEKGCNDLEWETDFTRTESHCSNEFKVFPRIGTGCTAEYCVGSQCTLKVRPVGEPAHDQNSVASTYDEHSVSPTRASKLIEATLNDAVRIFKKYIAPGATHLIRVSEEVRNRVVDSICKEDGLVAAECFSECQALVFHIIEIDYFNHFLRSDFYCKHQIDVLTSGSVVLSDILYNETALFYFMEYMEQEGNQSLVEFWIAAENFQQHLMDKKGNYDPFVAQNDAIVLYDKFFSLQATCPLGFNNKIRFEVEQNICREEGPLPDCFRRPVNVVLRFMEKSYLPSFLTSQLYFKYLSELINTIQSSPGMLTRKRKSGSECSSELNISIQNTLLAMEDTASPPRKIIRNIDDREMSIDSRQLYDPDSLWRRRHQSGLSFGRINEMGRFETDVEPEPDRKEESRLTKVVKKLVNMEEDKAKEEMAWQVAEMIVKDITNLTIGTNEDES